MRIELDDAEVRKLQADLEQAGARVGKEITKVTRENGQRLLKATESRSPVRTGALKASWALETAGDGRSGSLSVRVRSTVRQAFFQEFGTSKMAAQPSAGPALEEVGPQYARDLEDVAAKVLE